MTTVRNIYPGNLAATAFARDDRLISPANRASAKAEFLFGRDAATSAFNLASSGAKATVIGAPVFHDRYAELGVGGYFDSGVTDTAELTLIAVANGLGNNFGWMITQYGGAGAFTNMDGNMRALTADAGGQTETDATNANPTPLNSWAVYVLRTTVTAGTSYTVKLDTFRTGARLGGTSSNVAQARRASGGADFMIGSANGGSDSGHVFGMAGAAILNTCLSDAALLAEAAAISTKLTALGIAC